MFQGQDQYYNYGGYDFTAGSTQFNGISDALGRIWNNINGTTAANQASANEAAINRAWTSKEAEIARNFNSAEAQANRDWETYMSNTAVQRNVADLKAAGINPASVSASGASTPSGTPATASMPSGYAASMHAGGSGGFLGLAGRLALGAIGVGLSAKFQNTAKMAAKHSTTYNIVRKVTKEATNAADALGVEKAKEALTLSGLREKEAESIKKEVERNLMKYGYMPGYNRDDWHSVDKTVNDYLKTRRF